MSVVNFWRVDEWGSVGVRLSCACLLPRSRKTSCVVERVFTSEKGVNFDSERAALAKASVARLDVERISCDVLVGDCKEIEGILWAVRVDR